MSINFIGAGAGSGKTHKLMNLVSLFLSEGMAPERIVATTFTKKAAEEIRERIQTQYLERGDFELAIAASAVTVGTVNSVAGRLLSLFAFEAGMSPELKVLEEEAATTLLARVLERTLGDEVITEINNLESHFGIKSAKDSKWQEYVKDIVKAARASAIPASSLPAMAKRNADALLALIGAPLADHDQAMVDALTTGVPEIKALQNASTAGTHKTYLNLCEEVLKDYSRGMPSWDQWLKLVSKHPAGMKDSHSLLIQSIARGWPAHKRFHNEVRRYLYILFTTAADVIQAYDEEKNRSGFMDFTDQEAKLYALLDKPAVVDRLRERIGVLLVDEFQDTSPIQLALFTKLSKIAETTYWVGDMKQAIYGFRGSDASLMEGILAEFEKTGTLSENLPDSWRSRPPLVHFCNDLFVPAFAPELPADRVALAPQRKEIPGEALMHMVLTDGNENVRVTQVARGVYELYTAGRLVEEKKTKTLRPLRWGDIAILARSNAHVASIASALRNAGIPLKASGTGLLATPEAALLIACLRRLNDQYDTLASTEILALTEGLSPEDWLTERIAWVETQGNEDKGLWRCGGNNANPVLAEIENFRHLSSVLAPLSLLDAIIARCGLERIALSWTQDIQRCRERQANIGAVRALVRSYEENTETASPSLSGLLLYLGEMGGAVPYPESAGDGVSVMTWHGAKGLEWPVVILHDIEAECHDVVWNQVRTLRDGTLNINAPLMGSWIRFWPKPFGRLETFNINFSVDTHVAELLERRDREERRLFYVGVTRARDLLVVTRISKKDPSAVLLNILGKNQSLLSEYRDGVSMLALPETAGVSVPYACVKPDPMTAPLLTASATAVPYWFDTTYKPVEYESARITPSAAQDPGTRNFIAGKKIDGAVKLVTDSHSDIQDLGIRYHAAFSFYANNPEHPSIIDFPENMRESVLTMLELMRYQWPDAVFHTELPLQAPLKSSNAGQYVDARIDLLVETDTGYHIVDHKLSAKREATDDLTAAKYAAQLEVYKQAVEAKTGKPVLGLWVALPQEGKLMEVR